ncbi:flagellin [Granulicella sp. dw_53]|uniref:flagellin N-terminal helical domain-containing protein n=1 Tax=Granulicella sp. dw_53 TaxID=2719792 RepID=UPI001BD2E5BE|nr:flagellin [Granulicella sp. dw_53]
MSLSVLNNIAAIYAQNNLNQSQNSLQNVLEQLSSGSRINSGADDASGLAVADGLHANVAALTQSTQNADDGVGLLQTADGALAQVTNLLDRAVTLATEASNQTLNSSQVSSANQEYQNILTEIANIGSTTNFNGNQVFSNTAKTVFVSDGTASGATTYNEVIGALTLNSVGVSSPTGTSTTTALAAPTVVAPTATANGTGTFDALGAGNTISGTLSVTVGGGAAVTSTIAAGTTLADAVTQLNTQYAAGTSGLVASVGTGADAGKLIITGPTGTANTLSFTGTTLSQTTDPNANGAGVDFSATSTNATLNANTATGILTSVTQAIADVAYQRGVIGADINQLQAASNVASSESTNLTSAESSIRSTNYGQATSDMAKFQVLSQTGIAALSQANSVQQEILKLLQ